MKINVVFQYGNWVVETSNMKPLLENVWVEELTLPLLMPLSDSPEFRILNDRSIQIEQFAADNYSYDGKYLQTDGARLVEYTYEGTRLIDRKYMDDPTLDWKRTQHSEIAKLVSELPDYKFVDTIGYAGNKDWCGWVMGSFPDHAIQHVVYVYRFKDVNDLIRCKLIVS
jgi:hypothetical protein